MPEAHVQRACAGCLWWVDQQDGWGQCYNPGWSPTHSVPIQGGDTRLLTRASAQCPQWAHEGNARDVLGFGGHADDSSR